METVVLLESIFGFAVFLVLGIREVGTGRGEVSEMC